MSNITLSQVERVILTNLFRVLERLEPECAEHRLRRVVVEGGYESEYYRLEEDLLDPVPPRVSEYVEAVLEMFEALESSYQRLEEAEKRGIEIDRIRFRGFDLNTEGLEFRLARFIVQDSDRRPGSRPDGDEYNSHTPMSARYSAMLTTWRQLGSGAKLTRASIVRIIDSN